MSSPLRRDGEIGIHEGLIITQVILFKFIAMNKQKWTDE